MLAKRSNVGFEFTNTKKVGEKRGKFYLLPTLCQLVCRLFLCLSHISTWVCQHKFAHFNLPCEGRFKRPETNPAVITQLKLTTKFRKCNSHFDYKSLKKLFIFLSVYNAHAYLGSWSLESHTVKAWKGTDAGFCCTSSPTVPSSLLGMSQNILPRIREIWNLEDFPSTEHEKNMLNGSLSEWRNKLSLLLSGRVNTASITFMEFSKHRNMTVFAFCHLNTPIDQWVSYTFLRFA